MNDYINIFNMMAFHGTSNRKNIGRAIILGIISGIYLSYFTLNSTIQSIITIGIPFIIIHQSFSDKISLIGNLAWDYKKQVKYSFMYYILICSGIYIIWNLISLFFNYIFIIIILNITYEQASIYEVYNIINQSYMFILSMCIYISYFPVCFMKKRKNWVLWIISSTTILFGYSFIIDTMIQKKSEDIYFNPLNFSSIPNYYIYLFLSILVLILITLLSYKVAYYFNRPKKYVEHIEGNLFKSNKTNKRKKLTKKIVIFSVISFSILVIIITIVFTINEINKEDYDVVAIALTEDSCYGPIGYKNEVYTITDKTFESENNLDIYDEKSNINIIGCFGFKYETKINDDKYTFVDYQSALINKVFGYNYVGTRKQDENGIYVSIDSSTYYYRKASSLETEIEKSEYSYFVIFDENWIDKSAFSLDNDRKVGKDGTNIIDNQLLKMLKETFGVAKYNIKDFQKYDKYYTLGAFYNQEDFESYQILNPLYIGCIIESDNKFYYCNKNNVIEGTLLEKFKNTIK
jgi:hypothetical protein